MSLYHSSTERFRDMQLMSLNRLCRDIVLSRYRSVAISFCRDIVLSRYRSVAISFCRDIVLSRYRSVAISFCRDIVLSRYRSVAISFCRDIVLSRYRSVAISFDYRYHRVHGLCFLAVVFAATIFIVPPIINGMFNWYVLH